MNSIKPIEKAVEAEVEGNIRELVRRDSTAFRQVDHEGDATANNLNNLLRRVSGTTLRELDNLIDELQTLREKLSTESTRVQRDIAEHADLSQSVMQITKIISESVKKLPGANARA